MRAKPLALLVPVLCLACESPPVEDEGGAEAATETETGDDATDSGSETTETETTETGSEGPPAPLYGDVQSLTLTLPDSGDEADVYYPADAEAPAPLLVLLQGALVPRTYYAPYAQAVAAWGFVVAVPDHPSPGFGGALFASPESITEAHAHLSSLAADPESELFEAIDPDALGALGHSFGGVAAIQGITGACAPPICSGPYTPPQALGAGAFYGTNMKPIDDGPVPVTPNMGVPLALIQGALDSLATVEETVETYEKIETPPKAYVEIDGANHYGLTSQDNPPESSPDPNAPTTEQALAIEASARWTALFMRAHLLDDTQAFSWVYQGAEDDALVTVVA
ncbi:alpha/beta hydrolase family protein, partial [Plesiocystis pacifica]